MCVSVRERLHKGAHILPSTWLHTKIHVYVYQLNFGREILEGISNVISCKITMHRTAARGKFTPPLFRNVTYTLGVKSISK